ncbi:rhodanese-like domain-containing protein [Bhargavaea cecembensis]|uniref:rhodanese-like domain-containing protein n=1 Tax=Bhargavaea cecembensis TaxID=394098 RepID=UPI00058EA0E8|nr:rhodanese-like domain-containing protein [Bhargavaea cecembensis]
MKWIIIAAIVLFLIWRLKPAKGVRTADTQALKGMLGDQTKQFIDVRTPAEYKGRHIKEFKNIPLNTLPQKASSLDKSKETVVICQSGMRSAQAARILKKQGFENVVNIRGGMGAWNG